VSCISIASAKAVLKYCSKSLHSWTRQVELTSSVSDAKVCVLKDSLVPLAQIFFRKFSFLVRYSALADFCPTTTDAGVFEYHCESFRSYLLSLPRIESSSCIEFCERHKFSAPYIRMGRMHVSPLISQTEEISHP